MTLAAAESTCCFLLLALPDGFHRINITVFLLTTDVPPSSSCCRKLLDERARVSTRDRPECRRLIVDRCPCYGGRPKIKA
jgi:hypothetical protein